MEQLPVVQQPQRIDQFLSKTLPYSRNFFHHIIKRWAVLIQRDSQQYICKKKSQKVLVWDRVYIESLKRFIDWGILQEAPAWSIDVCFECDDYLILNKPKWVISHPNSIWDMQQRSVVWWVYHYLNKQWLPSMWSFVRAWLIHRLDKETNGLMIIAKTEIWLQHFKMLFQQKSIATTLADKHAVPLKKRYRATAIKTPAAEDFLVTLKTKLPFTHQAPVTPKTPRPTTKDGITIFEAIVQETDHTVTFLIEILTGRTHQIRVHLSELWLPIQWDYLYGTEDKKWLQLSAVRLDFQDIDWTMRTITLDNK